MRKILPVLIVSMACTGCPTRPTMAPTRPAQLTIAEARRNHQTLLTERKGPPRQHYPAEPPKGASKTNYRSGGLELLAWVARPKGNGPFPAVLFLHGGHALQGEDYDTIEPFVEAGFLVLLPAFRAENGNPGHFEMLYGEIDDALAALAHLGTLTDVDPTRLYVWGHSTTGGTMALLVAELTNQVRGVVAVSPLPDLRAIVEASNAPPIENVDLPFDWRDPIETDLRSPARHLRDLAVPVLVVHGDREDEPVMQQAKSLQREAKALTKPVTVEVLRGADHLLAGNRAVLRAIEWFSSLEGK